MRIRLTHYPYLRATSVKPIKFFLKIRVTYSDQTLHFKYLRHTDCKNFNLQLQQSQNHVLINIRCCMVQAYPDVGWQETLKTQTISIFSLSVHDHCPVPDFHWEVSKKCSRRLTSLLSCSTFISWRAVTKSLMAILLAQFPVQDWEGH